MQKQSQSAQANYNRQKAGFGIGFGFSHGVLLQSGVARVVPYRNLSAKPICIARQQGLLFALEFYSAFLHKLDIPPLPGKPMTEASINSRSLYIASHDGDVLRDLIKQSLDKQIAIGLATTMEEVVANYNDEPIVLGRPDFVAELMKTYPSVEWVQSTWAGVDPLLAIANRDYQLTGVKDIFGPQMAEYVMAYLLAHEIRIFPRMRSQQERQWDEAPSGTLRGKILGVMGTGSIGRYVAKVAGHFGMHPVGFSATGRPTDPFERVYAGDSLTDFLAQCDYLLAVLPDTPATSNLLNGQAFAAMKDSAYLINAGRGNVIDEMALCEALNTGQLAGAVLDVFQEEPIPSGSPLWDTTDLLITGHIAATTNARDITRLFIENFRLFSNGQRLRYLVDFSKGY